MPMENDFSDRLVLVTGAAQGIGAAVIEQLLVLGAKVVALDVRFSANETIQKKSDQHFQAHLDVADFKQVEKVVHYIEKNIGAIDYLVSVAGILKPGELLENSIEDWQKTLSVNTSGVFFICRTVARFMQSRRQGAIVVVGSNAAGLPRMNMGAYAVSKAATTQLVKCLGLELAQYNIRCNCVAPGSTDTDMQRQLWTDEKSKERVIVGDLGNYRTGIPLKKIAKPENIANVITFLLSSGASHITMENILVDGGATLGC